MSVKNISDWTKNMQSFPQFENTFSYGTNNTLIYKGGGGYERIYFPVQAAAGAEIKFRLKFCSPTGYSCSYGDSQEYIAITSNRPDNTNPLSQQTILARTALSSAASNTPVQYEVSATPSSDGTVYLVIDFGYMVDGIQTELIYQDIEVDTTYSWHIDDDYGLINENFYAPFGKDFQKPYPKSIWYVDEEKGLVNGLLVEPYESKAGAFMNASNLQTVYIPRTCKKIGEWAFRNTALKKVCIAADCTYYPTSFPDGCEIEFYGGGGDFEQLYDSDNNMLLDSTGAMIYVRSDD